MAQNEILLKLRGTSDFSDIQSDVKTLQKYFSGLKLPDNISGKFKGQLQDLERELANYQKQIESGFKTKGDITGLEKTGKKIISLMNEVGSSFEKISTKQLEEAFQIDTSKLNKAKSEVAEIKDKIAEIFAGKNKDIPIRVKTEKSTKKITDLEIKLKKLYATSPTKKLDLLRDAIAEGDINKIEQAIAVLENFSKTMTGKNKQAFSEAFGEVRDILDNLTKKTKESLGNLNLEFQRAQSAADKLEKEVSNGVGETFEEVSAEIQKVANALREYDASAKNAAEGQLQLNNELGQVKDQITHFFSLINVAQLLRRAFQDVYNTVKELDAVMTETAVVTDFSIGDMWDKLPEYTAQAKALGVATKDLYAATTLYYQQGLDTNASMAAGVETMKMARIAGMEATQATDAMTAALRGFNMEVNETNAQNINDVYSKLAAITASDTEEIATAMSKTAAIANSVGAEFENIAVFLAQGIETTRESADAIGTAMKTILARFNEMKKDPSEIGEIDGEIVDANKVETALRSVGIALRDTNGEFRNADQVLLEVAEKWDSMSIMQQRYIATTAAGSRQQSRFIAFMQDYNRTMELQTAAYNAEGAAQQQYEKILESLDAKVAKLKDTWDEFILGIANNEAIKGMIDALSGLLDIINKMTNAPGILGGVLKSLMAFGVFKGGKALIGKGGLGERLFDASQIAKEAARGGESASKVFREAFEKSSKKNGKNMLQSITSIFKKDTWKVPMPKIDMKGEYSKEIKNLQNQLNNSIEFQLDDWEIDAKTDEIQRLTNAISDNNNIKEIQKQVNRATQSQINAYNAAVANGVSVEEASILLTKKGTLEEYKAVAAKKLGAQATKEQKEELAKKMMAEAASNTVTKMGILTQARYLLQMVFGTQAARESAAAKLVEAGSTWTAKVAQDALNSSLLACPIGWIVAGIAALVAGLVLLVKWAKTQTLEYKMEQAAEATKNAAWAANEAKSAYENLLTSKEEYDDFQKTLEDLIYGTLEWKKALVDANQQVLELLKTYPILAKYIQKDDQGVLTINEEGWSQILDTQVQNVETSQRALAVSQYQEHSLYRPQLQISSEDGYSSAVLSTMITEIGFRLFDPSFYQDLITEQLDLDPAKREQLMHASLVRTMLQDTYNGTNILDEEYLQKISNTHTISLGQATEYANDIENYYNELEEFYAQSELYAQQIGASIEGLSGLEWGEDLAWILGQRFTQEYDILANEVQKNMPTSYEKMVLEYAQALGTSTEIIKQQYANDTKGMEDLQRDLKGLKISKLMGDKSKEFLKGWSNFTEAQQRQIAPLLSQNGKGLPHWQMEMLASGNVGTGYLEALGITNENVSLFGYDTMDDMLDTVLSNINTAALAFSDSKKRLNDLTSNYGLIEDGDISNPHLITKSKKYSSLIRDMSIDEAENFNEVLSSLAIDAGAKGASIYLDLVDSLHQSLSEEGKKKLLDGLSLINLEDIKNAEELREALDSIGISAIDLTDEELKELNEEIQAMATVARRTIVDIDKAKKAIDAGKNSKKILQEAIDDNEYQFDEEEYETLKAAGASSSDFFYDGETYTYLSDTVDLLQQIQADTEAMRAKLLAQVEQDVTEGAQVADWVSGEEITLDESFIGPLQEQTSYTRESLIQSALNGNAIHMNGVIYDAKTIMGMILPEDMATEIGAWTEEMAKAQLQSYYDKYGLGGTVYSNNLSTFESVSNEQYGAMAANQSAIENADMYKKASKEVEKYQDKLEKNIDLTEQETIAYEKAKTMMEKSSQALRAKGKALGMTDKELDEYLGEGGKGEGLLGQIIAEKQLETNLRKTADATEDYFDALANGATGVDRDNALAGIAKEADFNLGLEVDVDWLAQADNLEAFRKAVNGTKEDYYGFIVGLKDKADDILGFASSTEEISQAFVQAGIDVSNQGEAIKSVVEGLDKIEFNINGEADFTQIFEQLLAVTGDVEQAYTILTQLAGTGVAFSIEGYAEGKALMESGRKMIESAGSGPLSTIQAMAGLSQMMAGAAKMSVVGKLTGGDLNDYTPLENGSGGGSSNKYDSSADKYHNLQMDINATAEERNKLEEEYAELLEDEDASLSDIQEKQQAIVDFLMKENELIDQKIAGRQSQIEEAFANNDVLSQYAYYDPETDSIKYKLDKNGNPLINSETDSTIGEKFDEGWDKANSYLDDKNSLEETRSENEELIAEYTEAGKNDLDDSFNTIEKIERIENEITNLQAERNILMEDASENSKAILESYAKEKELLDQQLEAQKKLNEERIVQHNENLEKAQAAGVMDYIINLGNGQFEVDQDTLDQMTQAEQDFILQWVEKLNESGDAVQESTEGVNDATQAVEEFENELQSGAFDFFDQIKEMLIADYQKKIDLLSQENEAILDAESKIFDSIQKSLDEQRQQRDNEKTVEDIQDKETRLAYLQADTTGANDLEIMNLQKELEDQKEDYTDQLIDQKITALQQQNDEAAAQRERQIELAQAQLDYAGENGTDINSKVQTLINEGTGLNGEILKGSELYKLIQKSTDFSSLTEEQKKTFINDLQTAAQSFKSYLELYNKVGTASSRFQIGDDVTKQMGLTGTGAKAEVSGVGLVTVTTTDGSRYTIESVESNLMGEIELATASNKIYSAADARAALRYAEGTADAQEEKKVEENFGFYDYDGNGIVEVDDAERMLATSARLEDVWNVKDLYTINKLIKNKDFNSMYDFNNDKKITEEDKKIFMEKFGKPKKFATGGLADYTGPAWLDGSKTRPELVLNAQDTQNFIQLKDILSSVMKNIGSKNSDEKTGDIYYEIHIDVEKLTSDYDVDDVANRVKTIIAQDAMYRNNNIINRLR